MANDDNDTNDDRDTRYKEILRDQLGSTGVTLLVNQSFIFILALIMVVTAIIGYLSSISKVPAVTQKLILPKVALL